MDSCQRPSTGFRRPLRVSAIVNDHQPTQLLAIRIWEFPLAGAFATGRAADSADLAKLSAVAAWCSFAAIRAAVGIVAECTRFCTSVFPGHRNCTWITARQGISGYGSESGSEGFFAGKFLGTLCMGNIVGTLNQENRNYDDNNFVHGNSTPAQLTGKGSTKTGKLELGRPQSPAIAVG